MLYALLLSLALLVGFVVLTQYEGRGGWRLFARARARLDERVAHFAFLVAHVDFAAFLREEVRRTALFLGHHALDGLLRAVRAVERGLSRLVRRVRMHRPVAAPSGEHTRPFVKTLSHFKEHLAATRPEMPEIR